MIKCCVTHNKLFDCIVWLLTQMAPHKYEKLLCNLIISAKKKSWTISYHNIMYILEILNKIPSNLVYEVM